MTNAENRAGEILRGPDRERLYLLLVDYAHKRARRYGWQTGKSLPQGSSPDAIANDIIVKVLQGDRNWDENKEPSLLNALKGMVASEISHLFSEYETVNVEPIAKLLPDGSERSADDFASADPSPEEMLMQSEQTQLEITALDMILIEVEGKPELEAVFLALYESDSLQEVARRTGIPIERVYSIRRELDRIAARITPARVARTAREREKS